MLVTLVFPCPAAARRKMCVIRNVPVVTAERSRDADVPVLILGLGNTVIEKAGSVSCFADRT